MTLAARVLGRSASILLLRAPPRSVPETGHTLPAAASATAVVTGRAVTEAEEKMPDEPGYKLKS
ncbi:MAG: hypothetical protein V7634_4057 [Bradyrhizobium sp.]|jgi:hypothetical protein